jgi:hypothetical protein
VEIAEILTSEVTPTVVYETEILATLANTDIVATPMPKASLVESELNATVQSETLLVTPEAPEAQTEAVKVVGEAFETAIPALAEADAVAVNVADDSAALAEANVSTDTLDSEIVSSERPAREYRDRRGRTRRSRNGNNERNERSPRNANNGNEASAFQPAVDLEPLVIELTNSQLVDIAPVPIVVLVEPEAGAAEEAFAVEPVVTKRNPKVVEQPDGNSQASVAQPETQMDATPALVENTVTSVIADDSTLPKRDETVSVTETVLDISTPTPEPQAQANEVEAITESPKVEDSLEVKAIPKKRPIWMHVDPTEADKAEQV